MSILPRALALSFLLTLALASAGSARSPWGHGRGHGPDPDLLEEHADELGLGDDTREAIRAIVEESRDSSAALRDELRGLHRQMKDLLSQDSPDEKAVMDLADRIGSLETELHKRRLSAMLRIRAELTPEQRKRLTELRREERGRHRGPVAEACREDREQLCEGAESPFERMQCMRDHRDELSDACRDALQALHRDHRLKPFRRRGEPTTD